MPVKVKICGITNLEDAAFATEAGADALGFVFFDRSPRHVSVSSAAQIAEALPALTLRVGVFVNPSEDLVFQAMRDCGLNLLQFHGDEEPEFCLQFGVMAMKAFRVSGPESLATCGKYQTDAFLLDAYSPTQLGGTGEAFNWDLAIQADQLGRPIFLAGGLTPQNVAEAVRKVRPFGVDVSSGVESVPGKKDQVKVRAFITAAKSVEF